MLTRVIFKATQVNILTLFTDTQTLDQGHSDQQQTVEAGFGQEASHVFLIIMYILGKFQVPFNLIEIESNTVVTTP